MKKTLIGLAVIGAVSGSAHAQNSVVVYGIIDSSVSYTDKALVPGTTSGATGSKFAVDSSRITGSRIGFKGTEDLGGGLNALFQLETGFNSDAGTLDGANNGVPNTNTLFRRISVLGLSGDFGSVFVGRQTDVAFQLMQWTSAGDFGGITGAVGHVLDRYIGTRTNNSIRYDTKTYNGFSGSAIYGLGEVAGQSTAGQALGFGGQYINGPLVLFTAYYQSRLGADATGISSDTGTLVAGNGKAGDIALKVFNLGTSYQAGPARVYVNWSQVKQPLATAATIPASGILPPGQIIGGANNSKANIYDLGVNYAITDPLRLLASVQRSVLDYAGGGQPTGKLTQINLGVDYFLSKRTDLYAVVSNLRASNTYNPGIGGVAAGQGNNQMVASFGIRHRF